jgi:hypothetical protein
MLFLTGTIVTRSMVKIYAFRYILLNDEFLLLMLLIIHKIMITDTYYLSYMEIGLSIMEIRLVYHRFYNALFNTFDSVLESRSRQCRN